MAHLTKPAKYDVEDSNIALLGSDLEARVREHAGDKEVAWSTAGVSPGLQVWRIEQFHVVTWPKERVGVFYNGDSYIVLHTYKKDLKTEALSYDLHFWLGRETSQDEAGTAAYKTVELDDHLHGAPVQYREIDGSESARFRSYFPRLLTQHGGAATGFHHVSLPPAPDVHRLYAISGSGAHLSVREVPATPAGLARGAVFVLDRGAEVWQFNARRSAGRERFQAAEFVRELADSTARRGGCDVRVVDEGASGAGTFLALFGVDAMPPTPAKPDAPGPGAARLFRISDQSGSPTFTPASAPTAGALDATDAYLLHDAAAVYVWLGRGADLREARLALQYAQRYLHGDGAAGEGVGAAMSLVVIRQGSENAAFAEALGRIGS